MEIKTINTGRHEDYNIFKTSEELLNSFSEEIPEAKERKTVLIAGGGIGGMSLDGPSNVHIRVFGTTMTRWPSLAAFQLYIPVYLRTMGIAEPMVRGLKLGAGIICSKTLAHMMPTTDVSTRIHLEDI